MPSADAWRAVRAFRNVDRPRRRFLSVDEAKRLLNAAAPDFSRLARGALYTGLRLGELLALRVADIAEGQVHVRHSKAGPSRTVPLSTEGAEFSNRSQPARQAMRCCSSGKAARNGQGYRSLARCGESVGLRRSHHPRWFHDLRRSYGSLLLNAGADVEVIQELLGHADLRMTRRAYAHLLNATVARTVKKKLPSFGLERSNVRKLRQ